MAGERVLIVDDHKEATRLIRKNLESLEQDLIIADVLSGEEALLELRGGHLDLLIADFRLPGISGLELMDKFKARNPDTKVILISGVTDPEIRKQVAQAGADAFFFKPIDIPEFLDAVERALGLVETILPSELSLHADEMIEEETEEQTKINMAGLIPQLRVSLDATAVIMVDDQGQVLVRAGDLPDPALETSLMPMLMRAFTAGVRISHFLGQNVPDHFYSFRGENYDLFLAPVGEAYCLLILTRPTLQQEMGNIATQVHNTAKSILLSLSRLGISTHISGQFSRPALSEGQVPQPGGEGVPVIHPETGELSDEAILAADQNLESLFSGLEEDQIQDADAFWESISSDEVDTESGSDTLSYDQAAKLGLAPSDE
jgi:CheY-like chemotaxis protein